MSSSGTSARTRFKELPRHVTHRPWPLPQRPWLGTMTWSELLFAHWPVDPDAMRARVPEGLELDEFDGRAWLGVVPFRMSNVGPRGLSRFPGASSFPELNVRTYVRAGGKPGVMFFSLDAASSVAVAGGRALHLPYYRARMSLDRATDGVRLTSVRIHRGAASARFDARYRPTGPVYLAEPGTLDHWLTERYCLYSVTPRGRVFRGEVHHLPWPLQPADATIGECALLDLPGLSDRPALLHYVEHLDVIAWRFRRVQGNGATLMHPTC